MSTPLHKPTFMRKLHSLFLVAEEQADFEAICWALMNLYLVKFDENAEPTFFDITNAESYKVYAYFAAACTAYMDFSSAVNEPVSYSLTA